MSVEQSGGINYYEADNVQVKLETQQPYREVSQEEVSAKDANV